MSLGNVFYNLALSFGYKPKVIKPFSKQITNNTITNKEIGKILQNTLGQVHFNWADKDYKLVDVNHLKDFLKTNTVNNIKYISNDMDCDDYSMILQGDITRWDSTLAFGIIWGTTPSENAHAWNWCVGNNKKIYFVEPQRDTIFLPTSEKAWWVLM